MSAQLPDANVLWNEVYHPSKSYGYWQCEFSIDISEGCAASVFRILEL